MLDRSLLTPNKCPVLKTRLTSNFQFLIPSDFPSLPQTHCHSFARWHSPLPLRAISSALSYQGVVLVTFVETASDGCHSHFQGDVKMQRLRQMRKKWICKWLQNCLFWREGTGYPSSRQFICMSADKNYLHCSRLSTIYRAIKILRGRFLHRIKIRCPKRCALDNA